MVRFRNYSVCKSAENTGDRHFQKVTRVLTICVEETNDVKSFLKKLDEKAWAVAAAREIVAEYHYSLLQSDLNNFSSKNGISSKSSAWVAGMHRFTNRYDGTGPVRNGLEASESPLALVALRIQTVLRDIDALWIPSIYPSLFACHHASATDHNPVGLGPARLVSDLLARTGYTFGLFESESEAGSIAAGAYDGGDSRSSSREHLDRTTLVNELEENAELAMIVEKVAVVCRMLYHLRVGPLLGSSALVSACHCVCSCNSRTDSPLTHYSLTHSLTTLTHHSLTTHSQIYSLERQLTLTHTGRQSDSSIALNFPIGFYSTVQRPASAIHHHRSTELISVDSKLVFDLHFPTTPV